MVRSISFLLTACGLTHTTMTVVIVGISPNTYTQTITGASAINFSGIPNGEYTYTLTTCSGFVFTGSTSPGVATYTFTHNAPAGKFCGCCGDDYFFPGTLTVSDSTGSCTLTGTAPGTANACGQKDTVYSGSKVITGVAGQCFGPGNGPTGCAAHTVDLTIFYSVGCSVSSGGMVTFSGTRRWVVNASATSTTPCDATFGAQTAAICCYVSGASHIPITAGSSPNRTSNEGAQSCGAINFTLDVTDSPDAGDANPACHPPLGNTLTVTE